MEQLTVISGNGEHFVLSLPDMAALESVAALFRKNQRSCAGDLRLMVIQHFRAFFPLRYQDSLKRISGTDALKLASALTSLVEKGKAGVFSPSLQEERENSFSPVCHRKELFPFPFSEENEKEKDTQGRSGEEYFEISSRQESAGEDLLISLSVKDGLREYSGEERIETTFLQSPSGEDTVISLSDKELFKEYKERTENFPEEKNSSQFLFLSEKTGNETGDFFTSCDSRETGKQMTLPEFSLRNDPAGAVSISVAVSEKNLPVLPFSLVSRFEKRKEPLPEKHFSNGTTQGGGEFFSTLPEGRGISDEVILAAFRFKWSLEYAASLPEELLRRCLDVAGVRRSLATSEIPVDVYTPEAIRKAAERAAKAVENYRNSC